MSKISRDIFGKLDDGSEVEQFTLSNKNGMTVQLLSFGATIRSIIVPDKDGNLSDVALGYDDIDWYAWKKGRNPYLGAIVGRVANRIAGAQFQIDGEVFNLAKNNGENCLHGGLKGFDKANWKPFVDESTNSVCFTYLSKDGEEGFPGDLLVNVKYTLTDSNSLKLHLNALTTKPTPVNLANHVYFNLGGQAGGAACLKEHIATFNADHYTPSNNENLIPTGEIRAVDGTQFDLRSPKALSKFLSENGPQAGGDKHGFDHNFCVNGEGMRLACRMEHPASGRVLECHSNQPGIQFYTGNFLPNDGSLKGKGDQEYGMHGGFCLETQIFPDAINQPNFPNDSVLRPGNVYDHRVTYTFSVKK